MSKFKKGLGAFMRGFNKPDEYNSQDVEFEITKLKSKIEGTKVNHILHLLLCIPTAGIWIIIWILIVISASSERSGYEKALKLEYQKKENLIKKEKSINSSDTTNHHDMDNTEKLIKLAELKEKGLITDDEFTAQKNKLL